MAKPRKLKVFRTPIGFHDAYVAAPSQKAALEAWGSDHNLFARGEAELVEDPALTAEPLAHPGEVIKRLRGTAEEQMAALPPDKKRQPARSPNTRQKPAKPLPRPTRASLDRAEEKLAVAEQRHAEALAALAKQEEDLRRLRRAGEKARDAELDKLRAAVDRQRDVYKRKLEEWRG